MFAPLLPILQNHRNIGIISHFRPDGDAIGSVIALGLALRQLGKHVTLWNEDPVPARYRFLEGSELISPLPEQRPSDIDLLICLDTGDWKRLGDRACALLADTPLKVNIDHHATNTRFGNCNIIDPGCAATGYIIQRLLKTLGTPLTPAIAAALYTAISTDTGSFQYSSTTPGVMHAAADLIAAGIDVGDINRRLYQEQPLSTLIVQREVLNHFIIEERGMLSHYSMEAGTKERLGITLEDTKDLVDIIRIIRGVKASAIFEDLEDGRIRISLRSKDPRVNVADIAAQFGGGGHSMAAGIRMRGNLSDCRERVLNALRQTLRTLPAD